VYDKDFIRQKNLPDKLLLVMAYLRIYCAKNGTISTSINYICHKIGYKPNHRENKINDQIINCLKWLQNYNYIQLKTNIDKALSNECIAIKINNDPNIFDCKNNYVILNEIEFDIIRKSKIDRRNKEDLLRVFLNIKKYMSFDKNTDALCYPSHSTLCKDCNISSKSVINNIIKDIVDIGLLYTYNPGKFIDNKGKIKFANNFYALEKDVLKPEICNEIMKNYYLSQGIIISEFIK